jgi:hypothetical protein
MIFAGLGCPNGCDFCCTSHFFSRKHIKLLPEGKDILAVMERYLDKHPKLTRTSYRLPSERWSAFDLWEKLQRKGTFPNLSVQVELQHARQRVWMRLEGALSPTEAASLGQRIRDSLARSKSRLVLDLKKLQWDKVQDLRPLRETLAAHRSRIRPHPA